jgi:hypothetical protein
LGSHTILFGQTGRANASVRWFVASDFHERMFGSLDVEYMIPVETWTVSWFHLDDIANVD